MLIGNREVARVLNEVRVGAQVHFKGYLAEYGTSERRSSSISMARSDRANDACETVFATEVDIIKGVERFWSVLFWSDMLRMLIVYILWFLYQREKILMPYRRRKADCFGVYNKHNDCVFKHVKMQKKID